MLSPGPQLFPLIIRLRNPNLYLIIQPIRCGKNGKQILSLQYILTILHIRKDIQNLILNPLQLNIILDIALVQLFKLLVFLGKLYRYDQTDQVFLQLMRSYREIDGCDLTDEINWILLLGVCGEEVNFELRVYIEKFIVEQNL